MKKNICLEVSQSVFTLASAGGSHRAASQQLQVLIVYFLHPTDLHYFQHDFVSLWLALQMLSENLSSSDSVGDD